MILATACNISSDLMLLGFPVVLVSTTSMELKKKIIIIAVLSLGIFSVRVYLPSATKKEVY